MRDTTESDDEDDAKRIAYARRIWNEAVEPRGTLAEKYLNGRGVTLDQALAGRVARLHPRCPFKDENDRPIFVPALVLAFTPITNTDPDCPPQAIHRIGLNADGSKRGKMMLGPVSGCAIKLDVAVNGTLAIAEGPEKSIKLRARGERPFWCPGSAGAIGTLEPVAGVTKLIIFADRDPSGVGEREARKCAERWTAVGRDVVIYTPRPEWGAKCDWLDVLNQNPDADFEEEGDVERCAPRVRRINAAAWHGKPVPPRRWTVLERVPRRNVTLASGAGAVGKSTLLLQLSAAHVIQLDEAHANRGDWFGSMPIPGRVLYVSAEEDEDELHFRTATIAEHLGAPLSALDGLEFMPLAGEDAVLGVPHRDGIVRATDLLALVREAALDLKAVTVIIDTSADVFAGNENDRAQVRQFIGLLRGLAIAADAAVILVSHPSVAGMKDDTGTSGSTAWENSVRARMYFKPMSVTKPKNGGGDDDEPKGDTDLRQLIIKKNNYGPPGEIIRMRYQNGLFVPIGTPTSLDKLAADKKAEQAFLDLLDRFTDQNQRVGPYKGPNYAPAKFAAHPDGKAFGSPKFAVAMQRLLDAKTIKIEDIGSRSRPCNILVRT